MIEISFANLGKFQSALIRAGKKYPAIAQDAMKRGMNGLRKEFMPDLAQRIPKLTSRRAQFGMWRVSVWRSGSGNVIGKFVPKTPQMQRNLAWLERGGSVRAKTSEYMAIPGEEIKQASGRVKPAFRGGPRAWAQGAARRYSMLVFKGDKAFVFRGRRRRGKPMVPVGPPLWTLVKRVTIGPKLGLRAYWAKAATKAAFMDRLRKNLIRDLGKEFLAGKAGDPAAVKRAAKRRAKFAKGN